MGQENLIIDLSALTTHYNSFCSEQTSFNQGLNSFNRSSICSIGNPQVRVMASNLNSSYALLNSGYSNINTWWSGHNASMRGIDSSVETSIHGVSEYDTGFSQAFSPMASQTPVETEPRPTQPEISLQERQQLINMGFPPNLISELIDQGFSVEIVSALRTRGFNAVDIRRLSTQGFTGNQIHTLVFQRGFHPGQIIDLVAREYLTPRNIIQTINSPVSYYQIMSRNQEGSAWDSFVRIFHERYEKPWEQTNEEVLAIHDAVIFTNSQQELLDETKEYLQIAKLLCAYVQELSNQHRWGIFYPDGGAHRRFWIDDDPSNLNWDLINQELEEIERNIMLSDGADSELIRFWFEDRHWPLNLDILDRPFSEIFEEMGVSNLSEFREWILKEETAVAELEFAIFEYNKAIAQMPYVSLYERIQDLELTDHTDTVDAEYRSFLDYQQSHIYNYLYINYGADEAANYFEAIRDDLRQFRGALAAAEFISNLDDMNRFCQFMYMFGVGTVDGVINWGQGMANFFNPSTERSVRDYEKMFIMQQLMAQTVPQEIQVLMANGELSEEEFAIQVRNHIIRETLPELELTDEAINNLLEADEFEELFAEFFENNNLYGMSREEFSQIMSAESWNRTLSNTYSFGVTFGNVLPSIVATVATKGIAAKAFPHMTTAQLAKFAATTSSMFVMFPSITGNETSRALIDGAEFWQARLYGVLRGLSETTLQRMLGNIPGINPNAKYAFTGFIRQGLIEGAMQEVVASSLRYFIYGEPMNLSKEDLTKAFFMGFLLSAFTTGGQAVINWGIGEVVVTSDTLIRIANASPNMDVMIANFEAYLDNQVLNNQANEINTDLTLEQTQLNSQEIIDSASNDLFARNIDMTMENELFLRNPQQYRDSHRTVIDMSPIDNASLESSLLNLSRVLTQRSQGINAGLTLDDVQTILDWSVLNARQTLQGGMYDASFPWGACGFITSMITQSLQQIGIEVTINNNGNFDYGTHRHEFGTAIIPVEIDGVVTNQQFLLDATYNQFLFGGNNASEILFLQSLQSNGFLHLTSSNAEMYFRILNSNNSHELNMPSGHRIINDINSQQTQTEQHMTISELIEAGNNLNPPVAVGVLESLANATNVVADSAFALGQGPMNVTATNARGTPIYNQVTEVTPRGRATPITATRFLTENAFVIDPMLGRTVYNYESASEINSFARWGAWYTLPNHYYRHVLNPPRPSQTIPGLTENFSPSNYLLRARAFYDNHANNLVKIEYDSYGRIEVIRMMDPVTGLFGSFNADGSIRTLYVPHHNLEGNKRYFDRQPGILQ